MRAPPIPCPPGPVGIEKRCRFSPMRTSRLQLAPRAVLSTPLDDGGVVLRSPLVLQPYARCVGDWLVGWSRHSPDREFLVEREGSGPGARWRRVPYGEALAAARSIGEALLEMGLSEHRPLLLLSDNSIDHALLQLGAMHAGIPVAPV